MIGVKFGTKLEPQTGALLQGLKQWPCKSKLSNFHQHVKCPSRGAGSWTMCTWSYVYVALRSVPQVSQVPHLLVTSCAWMLHVKLARLPLNIKFNVWLEGQSGR